jgi:hypothetical protein
MEAVMDNPQATGRGAMPPTPSGVQSMPPVAQVPPGMTSGARPGRPWPDQPAGAPTATIASYSQYADAQRVVDRLADQGFPVQYISIVGTGLRLEEQVLGRMTTGRAALSGAGAGAWLGLLVGLLLGLFAVTAWLGVVLTAVALGAVWGAILGAVAHAMTRGQRDFTSRSRLQASEYAVNVTEQFAEEARRWLNQQDWQQANMQR